jgi:acyl-CoA thioesterase II
VTATPARVQAVAQIELTDLLACLELTPGDHDGAWVGTNLPLGYPRVFGGQILAQAISAASRTVTGKDVKSLHTLFPREGREQAALTYDVGGEHVGRTFASTSVQVTQQGRPVALATALLHDGQEAGPEAQAPAPAMGPPKAAEEVDLGLVPWETRVLDGANLDDRSASPATFALWMRAAALPDDQVVHRALLAHATDLTLIGTALRPFEGYSQLDAHTTVPTAVTSHTLWFHRPFRLDDWLLLRQESPVAAHGRAYGRGDVYTADGTLVASYAQESLVRLPAPQT